MSKILSMTPEMMAECRRDFEKALSDGSLTNGKFNFTKSFESPHEKATIYFTPEAWCKMVMLLQEFSKEVAWHGVASRIDSEDSDEYLITDILVYPQTVTGTNVEMDTEKYAKWLMENDEDERFYNIHMQGHSHVNMHTSPSAVDLNHQEEIVAQLGPDDFYIFMIYNKSYQRDIRIYDMRKNTMFESKDVEVRLTDSIVSFDDFIKEAKSLVEEKTYTPSSYSGGQLYNKGSEFEPYRPSTPVTPASGDKKAGSTWANDKPKAKIDDGGWKNWDTGGRQLELPEMDADLSGEDENPYK